MSPLIPYPKKLKDYISRAAERGSCQHPNAAGKAASFLCGVTVSFKLEIDEERKEIREAAFQTTGCGYVAATAELICETLSGMKLFELSGLEPVEKRALEFFGEVPGERLHCLHLCFDAVQNALAAYRAGQAASWEGEDALICSCFGVSESVVTRSVRVERMRTVEEVGDDCNAGTGCGSCQPLIQEIIDGHS